MADINLASKIFKNQVVRFVLSVGIGFLVDAVSFFLIYHFILIQKSYQIFFYLAGNYSLSLSISYFLGVVVNFLMTRYFVFSDSKIPAYQQFFRFALVALLGYFASLFLLNFFINHFHLYPLFARIATALSLLVASFFIHKFFSFSLSPKHQ